MSQNTIMHVLPASVAQQQEAFELACSTAQGLQTMNNAGAAFQAVAVVTTLRSILTDEVMHNVFMPLMNTKIGFLTDRTGKPNKRGETKPPYSMPVVRDAIIDAITIGLCPTGNQFNIIAERMYPTKEGFTFLLHKLGVKYVVEPGYDQNTAQGYAIIPCKVSYEYNGKKNSFTISATVPKDNYSSPDQLRGKAERRAKKALYEYITGCDFGDADTDSNRVMTYEENDVTDVKEEPAKSKAESVEERANAIHARYMRQQKMQEASQGFTTNEPQ